MAHQGSSPFPLELLLKRELPNIGLGYIARSGVAPRTHYGFYFSLMVFRYKITPEAVWGTFHGLVGFGFAVWWQVTVQMAQAVRKLQ